MMIEAQVILDIAVDKRVVVFGAIDEPVLIVGPPMERLIVIDVYPDANLAHPHLYLCIRGDACMVTITHGWPPRESQL